MLQAKRLAEAEVSRLLRSCGVLAVRDRAALYTAAVAAPDVDTAPDRAAQMAQDPTLAEQTVVAVMQALYQLASRADAVPGYERLMMPRLRAEVSRDVARGVAAAYRAVFEAVAAPESGYGGACAAALRRPEQVDALLGVQEREG